MGEQQEQGQKVEYTGKTIDITPTRQGVEYMYQVFRAEQEKAQAKIEQLEHLLEAIEEGNVLETKTPIEFLYEVLEAGASHLLAKEQERVESMTDGITECERVLGITTATQEEETGE